MFHITSFFRTTTTATTGLMLVCGCLMIFVIFGTTVTFFILCCCYILYLCFASYHSFSPILTHILIHYMTTAAPFFFVSNNVVLGNHFKLSLCRWTTLYIYIYMCAYEIYVLCIEWMYRK